MNAADDFNFVEVLEDELAVARRTAARAVDRAAALAELRSHALAVQDVLRRPLRAAEVLQPRDPHDEETRAWLNALVDRIAPEED
jgi:hypothetical protein